MKTLQGAIEKHSILLSQYWNLSNKSLLLFYILIKGNNICFYQGYAKYLYTIGVSRIYLRKDDIFSAPGAEQT